MAQKREKEETELKVPESIPLCSPNLPIAAPRSTEISDLKLTSPEIIDLKLSGIDKARSSSAKSPEIIDPELESRSRSSGSSPEITDLMLFGTDGTDLKLSDADELRSSSAARSSPVMTDLKLSGSYELRSTSAKTPENPDLVAVKAGVKRPREVNRCSGAGCRKKVGLIPFRCRCGEMFCSEHRYSDRHDCSYDYKAAGREAIARENPVVKAAKIIKV